MRFIDLLISALRDNPLLTVAGAIGVAYAAIQALVEPIEHPIWRDSAQIILLAALLLGIIQAYLRHALPTWRHARDRLNQNHYIYTLRETLGSFLVTCLIVGSSSVAFGLEPTRALTDHLRFDSEAPRYCIRIAASCRKCARLHDINGRLTGPACLTLDSAGLVDDRLERWSRYRAFGVTAECSGQTISMDFTPWRLATCTTELRP